MAKNGEQDVAKETIEYWYSLFENYSVDAFLVALRRAVLESRGRLTPQSVMAYLPDPLGHPSAEEAWNAAPKSDHESAYITNQMMTALSAADDSIQRGDMVAARMCFIEVYNREVATAKITNERANFWLTEGNGLTLDEKSRSREQALLTANSHGWISDAERDAGLQRLECSKKDQLALENLSESAPVSSEVAKQHIAKIREMLKGA